MASIYKRERSPYWWIKTHDGKRFSTKLRFSDPVQARKAMDMLESVNASEKVANNDREVWDAWVPDYLHSRYENRKCSLKRVMQRWHHLRTFLAARSIRYPRQISTVEVDDYLKWRRTSGTKNGALAEISLLGMLMRRAMRLGYATVNPCVGLGIPKDKPVEKLEISGDHLALIWSRLQNKPEWMRVSFLVSLRTGCRLSETDVPLSCVSLDPPAIHFPHPKGDRPFSVPMPTDLIQIFRDLKARYGDGCSAWGPNKVSNASRRWCDFFAKIGLPQYSFHCLRVTYISRGARAGVPMAQMMRLVNHSSTAVHAIYVKFRPSDLVDTVKLLEAGKHWPDLGERATPDAPPARPEPGSPECNAP